MITFIIKAIVGTIAHLANLAAIACMGGYVFKFLWEWFIAPPFDLPSINIPQAIGIMLALSFPFAQPRRPQESPLEKDEDRDGEPKDIELGREFKLISRDFSNALLYFVFALLMAASVHQFV